MSNKLWKAVERRIAELLGGRRVPVTGRQRGDAPDIEHTHLSLEIKSRNTIPAWIRDAIDQANAANVQGNKLPVAILHENGTKYETDLVIIQLGDFIKYFMK